MRVSIGSGLQEPTDDTEAADDVRVGIGTNNGKGEELEELGGETGVGVVVDVGSTKAMSPFGRRVGTNWTPVLLLKMIPLGWV